MNEVRRNFERDKLIERNRIAIEKMAYDALESGVPIDKLVVMIIDIDDEVLGDIGRALLNHMQFAPRKSLQEHRIVCSSEQRDIKTLVAGEPELESFVRRTPQGHVIGIVLANSEMALVHIQPDPHTEIL